MRHTGGSGLFVVKELKASDNLFSMLAKTLRKWF